MKESYRQTPFLLATAVALALLLAGCGGGSSSTTEPVDPDPTPADMEAMALAAAQTAAANAAANAQTAANMAKADADAIAALEPDGEDSVRTMTARGTAADAQAAAGRAKMAGDNAAAATTSAAAKAFQTQAEDEETTASEHRMSIAGMLTAARQEDSDRTAKVMRDAITKVAETKEAAIAAEAMQSNDAGLGGSNADGTAVNTYSMGISRDRSGTKVEITDSGNAGDDDPKFMQAMDLGGGTTMHTREMEADDDGNVETEVVIVSTDIEAPKATPFAMVAGQELDARDLDEDEDADGDGTDDNDYTALNIIAGPNGVNLPKIMASRFTATTAAELTFDFDDNSTADMDEADEVAGTYNGASGTYRCNGGTACTVTLSENEDGDLMISAIAGDWVFSPDEGTTSDVPDSDYLDYGFWLKKTADEDGVVTYNEVETFARSQLPQNATTATGTAKYKGGATGVYVHTVSNSDGSRAQATAGHFTANANLIATFDQVNDDNNIGTIAPNMLNTLTGTINEFELSGGESQKWSVTLDGSIASGAVSGGTAKGGVGDGSFDATFHGPRSENNPNSADTAMQPTAVIGEFNAGFTNGSVAGAFGASMDDE